MSRGSARPRIESVAEFVLTVDEPSEVPDTCETFDEYVAEPTYTLIGEGTGAGDWSGTIVLDDAALAMECEPGDSYTLAVVILSIGRSDLGFPAHTDGAFSISDDATTDDEECHTFDPEWVEGEEAFACFSRTWRHKVMFDGAVHTTSYDTTTDDHMLEDEYYSRVAHVGYRALPNELPAGTTISYDVGGTGSAHVQVAKAYLIKNAAPYTSTPKGLTAGMDIPSMFSDGGIFFGFYATDNNGPNTCGIFTGELPGGPALEPSSAEMSWTANIAVTWWSPDGGPPPCTQMDIDAIYTAGVWIETIPPGGGTWVSGEAGLDGHATNVTAGWAWPAQGYY